MNIKNIFKFVLVVFACILVINVRADANNITIGDATSLSGYVANTKFSILKDSNGNYLYCVDNSLLTAENVNAKFIKESDAGVAYILLNGYPYKSFKNNKEQDYYITQSALWWYLDETQGTSNLSVSFKTSGLDTYDLRSSIKILVNGAINAKNNNQTSSIAISASSTDMNIEESGKYFVSSKLSLKNASNDYIVAIDSAPDGTIITDINGNEKTTFSKTDSFYVKTPVSSVTDTSASVKISATSKQSTYKGYIYQPTNTSMQNVVKLLKVTQNYKASGTLNISTSYVSVLKLDKETSNPIAGAKLTLKDSNGNTISTWESTTLAHVFKNLANGTYTIYEEEAPLGYKINEKPTTFTIDNDNKKYTIKIYNELQSNTVTISKIDKSTGNLLEGATIVIKDSNGNIIERFTTTSTPHVITTLKYGTYTIYEESAPVGYTKSNETREFTIDKDHTSFQINIENAKQEVAVVNPSQNIEVPDTATSSLLFIVLGIITIISGVIYLNYEKLSKFIK